MVGPDAARRAMVAAAGVARLASVRPDGRPHVVPVTFVLDGDTLATAVDHKPKSTAALQRLRNIEARPDVSVLVDHYEDDWSRLWWVRGDGRAVVLRGGDRARALVDRLVEKYPAYRARRPAGPVIAVTVDRWVTWSA